VQLNENSFEHNEELNGCIQYSQELKATRIIVK